MDEGIRTALIALVILILSSIGSIIGGRVAALNAVAKQRAQNEIDRANELEKTRIATEKMLNAEREENIKRSATLRTVMEDYRDQNTRLQNQHEELTRKYLAQDADLLKLKDQLKAAQDANTICSQQIEALETNLTGLHTQADAREKELDLLTIKVMELNNQLSSLRDTLSQVEAERDGLLKTVEHKNGELAARDQTIAELRAELDTMRDNVNGLQSRITTLETRLKGYEQPPAISVNSDQPLQPEGD